MFLDVTEFSAKTTTVNLENSIVIFVVETNRYVKQRRRFHGVTNFKIENESSNVE